MPESFTKAVVILWLAGVSVTSLGAYYGISVGDLGGTDALVEGMAVELGKSEASTLVSYGKLGENISFTLAGLFAGILSGYYWTALMEGSRAKKEGSDA